MCMLPKNYLIDLICVHAAKCIVVLDDELTCNNQIKSNQIFIAPLQQYHNMTIVYNTCVTFGVFAVSPLY